MWILPSRNTHYGKYIAPCPNIGYPIDPIFSPRPAYHNSGVPL